METGRFRWGLSMLASIGVGAICTFAFLLLGALRVATKFFEFLLWCSTHNNCDGSISPSRGLSPHPVRTALVAACEPPSSACDVRHSGKKNCAFAVNCGSLDINRVWWRFQYGARRRFSASTTFAFGG